MKDKNDWLCMYCIVFVTFWIIQCIRIMLPCNDTGRFPFKNSVSNQEITVGIFHLLNSDYSTSSMAFASLAKWNVVSQTKR